MADIRINSLPTTASASSSDDFLALDGATNGTRKLNAFSPTFGGNLTVSGTGTTGGNLSVRNALGYATGIHTGTTSDSTQQLLLSSNAAYNHAYISKGSTTLGIGFSSDNGSFVADDSITITAATKLVALAGNLTVSGTAIGLGGSTVPAWSSHNVLQTSDLASFGSFTGNKNAQVMHNAFWNGSAYKYIETAASSYYAQTAGVHSWFTAASGTAGNTITFAEAARITSGGNLLIGTTTDGGQKLQVSGTANIGNPFSTSTDDSLILHGKAVSDGSGNYGDYGSIVLSSSSSFTASARRYLITNAYLATDFAIIRSTNATTTPTIGTNGVVSSGTVDFRISESGNATFGGTIKTGSGSGETLSAGSIDVGADIGIASTQGIVQGGARIVTFTSGNATFAGNVTVNGVGNNTIKGDLLFGSGAWPTANYGRSADRVTISSSAGGPVLGLGDMQTGVAANRGATIYLFARGTDGTNDIAGASFISKRENATSGNFASTVEIGVSTASISNPQTRVTIADATTTFANAIAIGNTVNTVSPTSPNRTITMVIGGTTYYIHAKTTND